MSSYRFRHVQHIYVFINMFKKECVLFVLYVFYFVFLFRSFDKGISSRTTESYRPGFGV